MGKTSSQQRRSKLSYLESLLPHEQFSLQQKLSWFLALLITIGGTKALWEIIGALALHTLAWQAGGQGPSVVYNYITGIRLHRGNAKYAYLPMIVNAKDLTQLPVLTHVAHVLALVIGYISSIVHIRITDAAGRKNAKQRKRRLSQPRFPVTKRQGRKK